MRKKNKERKVFTYLLPILFRQNQDIKLIIIIINGHFRFSFCFCSELQN